MIIKGKTHSGIKFQIDSRIKDDARLLFLLTNANKEKEDPLKSGQSIMDLLALIFGSNDNVLTFMNEVANKNKGVCTSAKLIEEINDIFSVINAKNS